MEKLKIYFFSTNDFFRDHIHFLNFLSILKKSWKFYKIGRKLILKYIFFKYYFPKSENTRETAASAEFPLLSGGSPPSRRHRHPKWIFFAPILTQMVLKLPQSHEGSEYVLSFEIGQREGGFCSEQTEFQNHPVPY